VGLLYKNFKSKKLSKKLDHIKLRLQTKKMAFFTQSLRMQKATETTHPPLVPRNFTIITNKKRGQELSKT
jgi:hypothetical protein